MAGKKGSVWRVRHLPEAQPRACLQCGTIFTPQRKCAAAKFCRLVCSARYRCAVNQPLASANAYKTANKRRGTGAGRYVRRGYLHEHRAVMEAILGRRLLSTEIVHHKDGNGRNNSPDNLEIMSQSDHCKEHDFGHHPGARRGNPSPRKPLEIT